MSTPLFSSPGACTPATVGDARAALGAPAALKPVKAPLDGLAAAAQSDAAAAAAPAQQPLAEIPLLEWERSTSRVERACHLSGSGRPRDDDGGDAETFVFRTGASRWPFQRSAATRGPGATSSTCLRVERLVLAWLRLARTLNVSCTRDGTTNAGRALSMTMSLAQGSKQSVKSEHAGGCSTAVGVIGSKYDTSKVFVMGSASPLPPLPKSSVCTAAGAQRSCA